MFEVVNGPSNATLEHVLYSVVRGLQEATTTRIYCLSLHFAPCFLTFHVCNYVESLLFDPYTHFSYSFFTLSKYGNAIIKCADS